MKMNQANMKIFRLNFKNAVKDIEKLHGISIDLGNITFFENTLRTKLEVTNIDSTLDNIEQAKFASQCTRYGFTENDYNRTVTIGRSSYKLVGFKPVNRKYPCIVENHKGRYKMTKLQVSNNLI